MVTPEERYEQQHRKLQRAVFAGWFFGFLSFTLLVALLAR
jgi:hypothetical protein